MPSDTSHSPPPSLPAVSEDSLLTRRSLLARLQGHGSDAGWREFFDTYWRLIYNVARKSGLGDADAQDVVQDVMATLAQKLPEFRYDPARGKFRGWLLQQTRWRIGMLWRSGAKKREHIVAMEDAGQVEEPGESAMDALWEDEWKRHVLETALRRVQAKISARQFVIFDLVALRGMGVREVAANLGVNVVQVYLAKHRVEKLVKAEVRKLEAS